MCKHHETTTYYHVVDDDNGEHIATYTDRAAAYARRTHEAMVNGRDWTCVTTAPLDDPSNPSDILVDGQYYRHGQLISHTDIRDAA